MSLFKAFPAVALLGFSSALLPLTITAVLAAEADTPEANEEVQALDPIVVTATLGPRTASETLSSVMVIDEASIREQNPAELRDLLRGQPGISITSNGAFGKNTSVFIRGAANDATVFLVDGVRLHSATSGGAPWQYFPVELAERIEVVRGPRSTLYGADAVGGVIQVFTLDPEVGQRGWVTVGAGSFDTQKAGGGVSVTGDATRFSISGLHKETDGTAILEGGEDLGFRNTAGVGRLVHELDNGGEASVVLMQSEGNTEYDGGNTDFTIRTLGVRLEAPVSDDWRSAVQFAEARDERDSFNGSRLSVFNTSSRSARWENTITAGVHEVVAGAELLVDEVSGTTDFEATSRSNAAVFGQVRLSFGPTDLQLSLRADDNEAYGQEETGGIALGHELDHAHQVRLSYRTAFRAPTFNDLYYPLQEYAWGGSYAGNPDLEPEEAAALELGFSGRYDRWFWDLVVYQLEIEDLIVLRTDAQDNMAPENIDQARIRGAELSAGFDWAGWRAAAALTVADPRDRETDNRLRRRSAQSLRLDLDKTIHAWSLGASLVAEGYRYDDTANRNRLPGYTTLDLRAGWRFAEDWSAKLTVANLFDRQYTTALRSNRLRYIDAGRMAMLTVRYEFQ